MPGVQTSVGYAGGSLANPTYQAVCAGGTGHAEVVEVRYDPALCSLERLFHTFWRLHDPTAARSPQYRSAILCCTREQLRAACSAADRYAYGMRLRKPLVTQIALAGPYWRAEAYHQRYMAKRRAKA